MGRTAKLKEKNAAVNAARKARDRAYAAVFSEATKRKNRVEPGYFDVNKYWKDIVFPSNYRPQ